MLRCKGTVKRVSVRMMGGVMLLSGAWLTQMSRAQYGESGGTAAGQQTLVGVVSDAMCKGNHGGKDPAKCSMACVKDGSPWALVVDKKVYTLEGRLSGIDRLAGGKAKVTGKVTGEKITGSRVEVAD